MAIIVETGTGAADSESFASVAYCDTYHAGRGNAAWALLASDVREQALRKATDYMQQVYRERWAGIRVKTTQALDWPRYDVPRKDVGDYYSSVLVPEEVKRACAELALKASAAELAPDLGRPTINESVGPISVSYAAGARESVKYRAIDNLLAPLLCNSGMNLKVVRA